MSNDIKRFVNSDPALAPYQSKAPWAEAVEVPPNASLLFVSGQVPPVVDPDADPDDRAAYGDTRTQTAGVLRTIEQIVTRKGYEMGDIVKLVGYLCPDPDKGGEIDLDGFGDAYRDYFKVDGPLPARTRVQVVQLMNPAWLVEIDVILART
ncbi:Rid family hydrolase [Sulfitobacter sp. G21635-S1]|jgi:enamine deaminase RidA (YjgF/YER057c/UK114 family)|uniref:Rid family hydrolase n=1 Tax=Sulfitobacter sp. G21635-S1 TaxID=3014043 RepID=UPI0022B01C67|nr:Rid family hydrolase [Sulfitobacter sp. G21635-S1]MCZ4257008.1 Rid family hydrolase [Sulfitobacter sp. G21635-S1]